MSNCGSKIDRNQGFRQSESRSVELTRRLRDQIELAKKGGGDEPAKRQKERGKMLARERIANLIDKSANFMEIGTLAALGMYEEHGGAPSAGIITGVGRIHGKDVVIVANDSTVKAGAYFPMTIKKNLRAQEYPLRTESRLSTLSIRQEFSFRCNQRYFPTKMTLAEFSIITGS